MNIRHGVLNLFYAIVMKLSLKGSYLTSSIIRMKFQD